MTRMEIDISIDYRSYIRGAIDMLHESAKQHRLRGDGPGGHAAMCDAHKRRMQLVLEAIEKGETI